MVALGIERSRHVNPKHGVDDRHRGSPARQPGGRDARSRIERSREVNTGRGSSPPHRGIPIRCGRVRPDDLRRQIEYLPVAGPALKGIDSVAAERWRVGARPGWRPGIRMALSSLDVWTLCPL